MGAKVTVFYHLFDTTESDSSRAGFYDGEYGGEWDLDMH